MACLKARLYQGYHFFPAMLDLQEEIILSPPAQQQAKKVAAEGVHSARMTALAHAGVLQNCAKHEAVQLVN